MSDINTHYQVSPEFIDLHEMAIPRHDRSPMNFREIRSDAYAAAEKYSHGEFCFTWVTVTALVDHIGATIGAADPHPDAIWEASRYHVDRHSFIAGVRWLQEQIKAVIKPVPLDDEEGGQ